METVTITRQAADPLCLRASIGGTAKMGYYCMFRGDQGEVLAMLEEVLKAMRAAPPMQVAKEGPPKIGLS